LLNCPDLLADFHSSNPSKSIALHSAQPLLPGGTVRTPSSSVTLSHSYGHQTPLISTKRSSNATGV
jgi:hypothetical protein